MPKRRNNSKIGLEVLEDNLEYNSKIGSVMVWVCVICMIMFSIGLGIYAIIPTSETCNKEIEDCDKKPKKRQLWLLPTSLAMILIAVLFLLFTKWYIRVLKENKLQQIQIVKNLFKRR